MHSIRRTAIAALVLITAVIPVPVAHADLKWPDTELSRHVQAWFAQLKGTEAEAREFFATHFAPAALAQMPIEGRIERRRGLIERTGGVTPLEVMASTDSTMQVRVKAGNGDEPVAIVEAEGAPPHRIQSVRLELGGPGAAPHAPAGPPLTDSEVVAAVRALVDRSARADSFSGVVLLARDGKPLLRQAWGLADRAKKTPLNPETRLNLGSIPKVMTRVALAQLAQAGKLSLDDKLSKYLPDFPRASDITLDMLVHHRSGVGDVFNARYDAMDHSKLKHNHDYLALIQDQPLWFEPGTSERYSNGGYVLLGEVITKVSGMDYYDYMAKNVFAPAGMKATASLIEGDGTPNVARGYTHFGAAAGKERDNAPYRPARGSAAGGSYSTVDDMLAFDQALLGARLCDPAWSSWVVGGPRPQAGATSAEALKTPAFAYAGGAEGISSEWQREGGVTLITLTNRDPELSGVVVHPLGELVRRMKP